MPKTQNLKFIIADENDNLESKLAIEEKTQ